MRRREHLIPYEKNKKIIQLDRRGTVSGKTLPWAFVCGILAVLCILYCLSIYFFMGYGTRFFLIWGVMGVFLGSLSFLLAKPLLLAKIPRFIRRLFVIVLIVGLVVFAGVEGMILSRFAERAEAGADYVIVLGAQWKTSGPSYVLKQRLDVAVDYLQENPETKVIVSGGQGFNEPITEALGMKEYLMDAGIEEERILMEDASTNTYENLNNSSQFLNKEMDRVVVVTNNFHVFRACGIASHQGYENVQGLSAGSYPGMIPNNLLREFFGVIKDTFVGNM